jgi:DNA-directed RNA polymerase specialized sigma24 family protein
MNYTKQFKGFVKRVAWKNQTALPDLTLTEIEAECWTALAAAIQRWDGSKGKLYSWIYTNVTGRMKDLRKRPKRMEINLENWDFPDTKTDLSEMSLKNINHDDPLIDERCAIIRILSEIHHKN